MSVNHNQLNQSVYTETPVETRAQMPIYQAARELAVKHTQTGNVLDIGCSDGVATWGLESGIRVYGIDMSVAAVQTAINHSAEYLAACADIKALPFSKKSLEKVDTVLLLDILEHEEWEDSTHVLEELRTTLPEDHTLIVSLPIISSGSLETWRARVNTALHLGRRPTTGLHDRTHRILTGQQGHRNLFSEAGYVVREEFQTNRIEGVTGDWAWKPDELPLDSLLVEQLQEAHIPASLQRGAVTLGRFASKAYHTATASDSDTIRQTAQNMVAFQGLYVLKPTVEN